MNRKLCMLIAAGLLASLSLFVVGCEMCCNSSKGSGSMVITDPKTNATHKATFSYRVECVGSYLSTAEANADRKVTGRLEYHDHGLWEKTLENNEKVLLTVALHADIDNVVNTLEVAPIVLNAERAARLPGAPPSYYDFLPPFDYRNKDQTEIYCSKTAPNLVIFRGHYFPQPKELGEGGVVTIMVMDLGKPGASNEDRFEIKVDTGVFAGYRMRGALAGGNIKAL